MNKKISRLCILIFLLLSKSARGEVIDSSYKVHNDQYSKPKVFDFVTDIPTSLKEGWNFSFNTKPSTLWTWGGVLSSSAILYYYDEKIYKHARIFARKIGLGNDDHTKPMITFSNFNIFRGPTDLGSAIHFIGDGWLQAMTAGSFALSGSIRNDNRAMQTGSQIMNSMLSASIPTQLLKRATGREDPNRASKYRGRWRPFDKNYTGDTSAYDAVPSGHIMAAMSTLTVIDANYPEYKSVIRPVGFVLLTSLSFQMVNIGVHWASDYPLGLAIGYVFGKVASSHGKKKSEDLDKKTSISDWQILPLYSVTPQERAYGAVTSFNF